MLGLPTAFPGNLQAAAVDAIRSGACSVAVAGSISMMLPQENHAHAPGLIWSADGQCRPFDAGANGTANCNGGGAFVLKDYDQVSAQTICALDGFSCGCVVSRSVCCRGVAGVSLTCVFTDVHMCTYAHVCVCMRVEPVRTRVCMCVHVRVCMCINFCVGCCERERWRVCGHVRACECVLMGVFMGGCVRTMVHKLMCAAE
jgi:hypothetical protein